jgi:serine/threonine-protein kinase
VRQSPFFNVFTTLDLGLMPGDEAAAMVRAIAGRAGFDLGRDGAELVLGLGGNFPFFAQVAGSCLFELSREGLRADAGAVTERFRAEAAGHYRYFVDHLPDDERRALEALDRGEAIPAALERRLARRSLVVRPAGGPPRPFSPDFAAYLHELVAAEATRAVALTPRAGPAAAATTAAAAEPAPGVVVNDRYALVRSLGSGGFGLVWAADDRALGRTVALKLLRLDRDREGGPEMRARFEREARALARMKHPNILTVFDLGSWRGQPFLVMEMVGAGTLAERLERDRPIGWGEAARIGRDVALGLGYAHALGIIHRDVKPSNILLERDGRVLLGDFGILRWRESPSGGGADVLTSPGRAVGTPAYMAPEQLCSTSFDHRADLYALGLVLYECLTGCRPFEGESASGMLRRMLQEAPPDPRRLAPHVPEGLNAVVRRALRAEPGERPASGEELARALAPFAAGPGG